MFFLSPPRLASKNPFEQRSSQLAPSAVFSLKLASLLRQLVPSSACHNPSAMQVTFLLLHFSQYLFFLPPLLCQENIYRHCAAQKKYILYVPGNSNIQFLSLQICHIREKADQRCIRCLHLLLPNLKKKKSFCLKKNNNNHSKG